MSCRVAGHGTDIFTSDEAFLLEGVRDAKAKSGSASPQKNSTLDDKIKRAKSTEYVYSS